MKNMILIVGLGNPGRKFKKTRHNAGFRVIDGFVRENNFPKLKLSKKFNSLISEGSLNRKKIILAKPQTFVNDSGKAMRPLVKDLKLKTENLFVVHDDIDLPLGKIKISKGRGAAGHKGVQSIINTLGTKNFVRFRVGILPKSGKPKRIENFVLKKFTKKEEEVIRKIVKRVVGTIELSLKEGIEKAMSNQ